MNIIAEAGSTIIGADPAFLAVRNLHIGGTLVGSRQDIQAALNYAKRGLLKEVCEVRPMSRIAESVEQLRKGEVPGRIVIDFNMD